ncbi:MAG: putative lipoprotein [Candidatus Jettenia ecosi]|uniref:Putative lipoprotein n=1 Tax=Candidatus Jettenia ecosi TaxID=2494326 RepID=A0A533Q7D4_9BACT|nr:MAG: putative lipoprotein [Candidatus Jettenia ecosi]
MRKFILYATMMVLLFSLATTLTADVVTVFEHTYVRQTGSPITQTDTFPGIKSLTTLRVTNGGLEKADNKKVSSADIVLNKETIIDSSNFNKNVASVGVEKTLDGKINTIEVTVRGKPGGALTVQVLAEDGDIDFDNDGFTGAEGDCDDNNSSVNPKAQEICDDVDNNCDGQIDEELKTTFYGDADGDGYGNPQVTTKACSQPSGYVANNTDCDDTNAAVNPGATEIKKNGIDDDCNASTPDDDTGVNLPPDPGEEGKKTLLGIDMDGDGVRDDIQRYIYFTYPDDKKLRLGLTYYAKEFQDVLKDANDREAAYEHAKKIVRHDECLWYLRGEESIDICSALRAKILNTRERSIAYIKYNDSLAGRIISLAPRKEWKDSCSFDVDDTGGDQ